MTEQEIIGIWSFDAGYKTDLATDKQLHFKENGVGCVVAEGEVIINFEWALEQNGEDILIGKSSLPTGKRIGNQALTEAGASLKNDELPLGTFRVIEFEKFSIPFGIRKFVKLSV